MSPSIVGREPEVCYEVRWPDGRRFDSRRKVNAEQARLLVAGRACDEVRSATGILRYLVMRRNPPPRGFAQIRAEANYTTVETALLHEHKASKRKGL